MLESCSEPSSAVDLLKFRVIKHCKPSSRTKAHSLAVILSHYQVVWAQDWHGDIWLPRFAIGLRIRTNFLHERLCNFSNYSRIDYDKTVIDERKKSVSHLLNRDISEISSVLLMRVFIICSFKKKPCNYILQCVCVC